MCAAAWFLRVTTTHTHTLLLRRMWLCCFGGPPSLFQTYLHGLSIRAEKAAGMSLRVTTHAHITSKGDAVMLFGGGASLVVPDMSAFVVDTC